MQPITVNFYVRKPKDYLNYHLSTFKVEPSVNFPNQIVEEVMHLSKKDKQNYEKIVKSFVATAISFLSLSSKSMASELNEPTTQHVISANIPSELVEPLMELIGLAIGGSILLTVILLIGAGMLRQFIKRLIFISSLPT